MRPSALFPRVFAIAALSLVVGGTALAEPALTIGTGGPAGVYYQAGRMLCALLAAGEGGAATACEARESDGSVANLLDLRAGRQQLAIVQSDWQHHAVNGTDRFAEDGPDGELRALFALHSEPFLLVARRDAGIRRLPDLAGKRVNIGNPGSGQRATMEIVMRQMGWGHASFGLVDELPAEQQSLALCGAHVQAMVYVVGLPNESLHQAMRLCDAVIVEVSGRAIDSLRATYPFYTAMTVPGGLYAGNPRDVPTFGVTATVVGSSRLDPETAYRLTKAVFENLDALRRSHPAFRHLIPRRMMSEGLSAPLHEGARRYYRERGWL